VFLRTGNPRPVLEAAVVAVNDEVPATLALVVETEGSTYAHAGTMALFTACSTVGWLSGGCLEPELARCAEQAAAESRLGWIEIDTRDDAALFSGSAIGCRGRLRVALLPLAALPGVEALLATWLEGGATMQRGVSAQGRVELEVRGTGRTWQLPSAAADWADERAQWALPLPPLPEILLLGAGPETAGLLKLLDQVGWRATLAEPRPHWRDLAVGAERTASDMREALASGSGYAAALVMHHNFELDLQALEALGDTGIPFIGLLGPPRRRADLWRLLSAAAQSSLAGRLHAPVGLDLGGQGPEAIALSIAAQLQQWRASSPPD
jgi:xanthine dehydrogenase accessory factor